MNARIQLTPLDPKFQLALYVAASIGALNGASYLFGQNGPRYTNQALVDAKTLTKQLEPYLNQDYQKCDLGDKGVVWFKYSNLDEQGKKRVLEAISLYDGVDHFLGLEGAVNGDGLMNVKLTFNPRSPSFKIEDSDDVDGVFQWYSWYYSEKVLTADLTALVNDAMLVRIVEGTDKKLCGPIHKFSF